MVHAGQMIRLFVSSTFSDFQIERKVLQTTVFPALRTLCHAHGVRFQAVDLRWGITEEASKDQRTMTICFDEIRRCRDVSPDLYFVVLLGDRYGNHLLPEQIPAAEYDALCQHIATQDLPLIEYWYRRDDNAVPAIYVLQSRKDSQVSDADWKVAAHGLRTILSVACTRASLPPEAHLKYLASVTHQEIYTGVLRNPGDEHHALCVLRTITGTPTGPYVDDYIENNPDARERLNGLKSTITSRVLSDRILSYQAPWIENALFIDPKAYSEQMLAFLKPHIMAALERGQSSRQSSSAQSDHSIELEVDVHKRFTEKLTHDFTGREVPLLSIADYLDANDTGPLVVSGSSGSGKTTLLAKVVEVAQATHPDAEIIVRYIGVSPSTSNLQALLESLCHQISRIYGGDGSTIPTDENGLVREFPKRLALARSEKPIILVIDALDLLGEEAQPVSWIPTNLPNYVRLVVSVLPNRPEFTALQQQLSGQSTPRVVMLDAMTESEGKQLLNLWMSEAHRALQDDQRTMVLNAFRQQGLPLYLRLAFEEARQWCSYTAIQPLKPDIPGILRDLFDRLSLNVNHGPAFVAHGLGYLRAAKYGLTEDEILDVLSADPEVAADIARISPSSPPINSDYPLPVVLWSRLHFDLEPYLSESSLGGTPLMTFYHRQLGEVVTEYYLPDNEKLKRHLRLADYFQRQWRVPSYHAIMELPYHQAEAGLWQQGVVVLSDIEYLQKRIDFEGTPTGVSLMMQAIAKQIPPSESTHRFFSNFISLFTEQRYALARSPRSVFTQLYSSILPLASKPNDVFAQWTAAQERKLLRSGTSWLRHLGGVKFASDGILTLGLSSGDGADGGHSSRVNALAVYNGGQFALSVANDSNVILWDLNFLVRKALLLEHQGAVLNCDISRDGNFAVTADVTGKLIVWRLVDEPYPVKVITDPHYDATEIMSCAISPDNRTIGYSRGDGTFKLAQLSEGGVEGSFVFQEPLSHGYALKRPGEEAVEDRDLFVYFPISGSTFFPSGESLLIFSRYWRSCEKRSIYTFEIEVKYGRGQSFNCATLSSDGKYILSGTTKGQLCLFDAEYEDSILTIDAHSDQVLSCAFSKDGKLAASTGQDGKMKLWDLQSGKEARVYTELAIAISSCCFIGETRKMLAGGIDGSVHLLYEEKQYGQILIDNSRERGSWWSRLLRSPKNDPQGRNSDRTSHNQRVCCLAINTVESIGISVADDGSIIRWHLGKEPWPLAFDNWQAEILSCAVQHDGLESAFGCADGKLLIWDHVTNSKRLLGIHERAVVTCSYLKKDFRLLVGDESGAITLWDTRSRYRIWVRRAHERGVLAATLYKDEEFVVSTGQDDKLKLWHTQSGTDVWALSGRIPWLSKDGSLCATKRKDHVEVRDIFSVELLAQFPVGSEDVNMCIFSPLGDFVVLVIDVGVSVYSCMSQRPIAAFSTRTLVTSAYLSRTKLLLGLKDGNVYCFSLENFSEQALGSTPQMRLIAEAARRVAPATARRFAIEVIMKQREMDTSLKETYGLWSDAVASLIALSNPALAEAWREMSFREKYLTVRKTICDFQTTVFFLND